MRPGISIRSDDFKCPQCGTRATKKRIIANNYACFNPKCELNVRLMVHGEITNTGKVSKLYGWVLEPGKLLEKKYEIVKMLGKGGFGATYLARDKSMFNQLRAIKEIPRQYCDGKEDEFLTLLNHPAIPKLYERFNAGKFHYSVMEFIEGRNLDDKVKLRTKGLAEAEVMKFADQLFEVLKYIHSQKVVHRDLKPDNVLVRKDGNISLIDFGIAKKFYTGFGTRYLARAASNFYSPPEQYRPGKGYTDFQSDIYSAGAILYFVATGIEPTDALSRDPKKDITPLPSSLNSQISKNLESVIVKAMKMNKTQRFRTIEEMKKAMFSNGTTTTSKVCPKCQAIIGADDKFCSHCGAGTHPLTGGPVSSFVFSNKKIAKNLRQLVQICYQDWNDAIKHLYNGDFENWLESFKEGKKIAEKAGEIRTSQADKNFGLNEFLMSSGYGLSPQIQIQPTKIKVKKIPRGSRMRVILSITNKGHGYLKGSISIIDNWIHCSQQSFFCLNKSTVKLILNIDTKFLNADNRYQTKIEIKSNGGNITVPVTISVAMISSQPKVALQPIKKPARTISYVKSIFLFLVIALLIRHLGPTATFSVASLWVIILMTLLLGAMNFRSGDLLFIVGCLIGASLGALMNIISFYTYSIVNQNIVVPVLKSLNRAYTVQMSYAGWGVIGIYLGGTLALFKKKAG